MNLLKSFLLLPMALCGLPLQSFSQQSPKQQVPTIVTKGPLGTVTKCVAAAGDIYWLEDDDKKILYTNREIGGYPNLLLRTNTAIQQFTADADGVYYLSENKFEMAGESDWIPQGDLRAMGKKKPITTLRQNFRIDDARFVGADTKDIYLLTVDANQDRALMRFPKNGEQPKFLEVKIRSTISTAVMDEKDIYWFDPGYRTISSVAKTGGIPKLLFESQDETLDPLTMAIGDNHLYLITRENQILQIDKLGGKSRVLYPGTGVEFFGPHLTVDGGYIYWIDNNNIMRMSSNGGAATSIAQAVSPTCLTVDDKYVFWFQDKGLLKAQK